MTPFVPRGYQDIIIDHVIDTPRCAVWADMGMGKTVSLLTVVDGLLLAEAGPVLVLAPARVCVSTWPDEARKWGHTAHLKVVAVTGALKDRLVAVNTAADVHCVNYENIPWLVKFWGDKWPYKTVIADESTKLKSFRLRQGGKRAQALAQVIHTKVKRFVGLTGTPAPNGLQDLWGQMWMVDRGQRLGRTYDAFKQRWFRPHPSGFGLEPLAHAQAEIQELLRDVCVTVVAKDWFDLRQPIVNNIYVTLPARAQQIYEDMEKRMFAELDSGEQLEAFGAAARTIKCLQLASGAAYINGGNTAWEEIHDQKLQALEEIVEEASGAPVLVAYHFKSDLARLKKHFPKGRELDKKPQTMLDWNKGKIALLFAHPQSAGHGVNLQDGGNILVYFSHWWNLEERMQIAERIGPVRQLQSGHDRPVFIHNLIARDTVDEMVIERVETKRAVQDILLAALKRRKGKPLENSFK